MKNKSKIKTIVWRLTVALIIVSLTIATYSYTILFISKRQAFDYIPLDNSKKNILLEKIISEKNEIEYITLSKYEIKQKVKQVVNPILFIEENVDQLKGDNSVGLTWLVIRLIQIKNSLNNYDYCFVLTHEYVHLQYMLTDENLVDFIAIKLLYNSGDKYLKRVACDRIISKLLYDCGSEYDCSYQLYQYFILKENI